MHDKNLQTLRLCQANINPPLQKKPHFSEFHYILILLLYIKNSDNNECLLIYR